MANKKLVLLTQYFPYKGPVEFLDDEILILSKKYDLVKIGCIRPQSSQLGYVLPPNVEVSPLKPQGKVGLLKNISFFKILRIIRLMLNESNPLNLKFVLNRLHTLLRAFAISEFIMRMNVDFKNTTFYSFWMNDNALALSLLKTDNKIDKFVLRTHGYDLYDVRNIYGAIPFRKFVYQQANLILPISNHGVNYLKTKFSNYSAKYKLSCLGVPSYGLNPYASETIIRIVSCSRLIPLKRVEKIIKVISLLTSKKTVEWIHFGGGELASQIDKLAREKLSGKASYTLMGQTPKVEILNYYKTNQVDFFINLSEHEGLPVSMMEAQSFGIPIVANDVGGVNEIVNDQTGILFKKNENCKKIANAISESLLLERNNKLRQKSRHFWKENFNSEKNYTEFVEIIESI